MKKEPCAVKLGRKGGKVSTRKKKGIHSPAYKKKRRVVAKKAAVKKAAVKKKAVAKKKVVAKKVAKKTAKKK